jgi:hypothetical protein
VEEGDVSRVAIQGLNRQLEEQAKAKERGDSNDGKKLDVSGVPRRPAAEGCAAPPQ